MKTHPGDQAVATLSPDALLVIDSSTCIILVTPERRITVTNVDLWKEELGNARVFAEIYYDDLIAEAEA